MTNGVARRTSIVMAVASVVLLILAAVPALGHAELVSTTIEDGAVLDAPVDRIGLEFDDVVTPVSMRLLEGRSSLAGSVVLGWRQPTTNRS